MEGVGEVGGEDGEVGEQGHVPCCEDEEGGVVEGYFEGTQSREGECDVAGARLGGGKVGTVGAE